MNQLPEDLVLRTLCYILRHNPELYRVSVNEQGWASAQRVLSALRVRSRKLCLWQPWTYARLRAFVTAHRARLELRGNRIRARYGHSLPVTLGNVKDPPGVLFHGTTDVYMNSIRMLGLKAYRRTFVHLTSNPDYAEEVADSHEGHPITLRVRARDAANSGDITFRQATEHVWLVKMLPVRFVELPRPENSEVNVC
jgi:putative RNA 2'-phosphotransferase